MHLNALCWISLRRCCFGLETRVTIKISTHPALLPYKCWLIFMGMKQKKYPKWSTQKNWVFHLHKFSIFFSKISGIGPWVSRINWCKRHWCGPTYMVVRLSEAKKRAKNAKNAGSKDGSKFPWLPWFPAQNNTCAKICNTVYHWYLIMLKYANSLGKIILLKIIKNILNMSEIAAGTVFERKWH